MDRRRGFKFNHVLPLVTKLFVAKANSRTLVDQSIQVCFV